MHNGASPSVDRYDMLTGTYKHRMAPGSDGVVNNYHLYERVKSQEGAQKDQNVPYLPILMSSK